MSQNLAIDEFDRPTLQAAVTVLADDAFFIEDLGHATYNIVRKIDTGVDFCATVLVAGVGEPVRWYASAASTDSGEPVEGVEFFSGPFAEDTTAEQAATWVRDTYAKAAQQVADAQ